jgi:hypothetical protein
VQKTDLRGESAGVGDDRCRRRHHRQGQRIAPREVVREPAGGTDE